MTKEIISYLSTPEEVKAAYEKMGVKTARISGLNDKFMTVPEKFEVFGLVPKDVTINGRTMQNIPAFSIDYSDKSEPVFRQSEPLVKIW